MLFDQSTPDTSIYMIAGYTIFFLIAAIYLVSFYVRARNLRRDLETLESIESESKTHAPAAAPAPAPARAKSSRPKNARSKQARKKTIKKR